MVVQEGEIGHLSSLFLFTNSLSLNSKLVFHRSCSCKSARKEYHWIQELREFDFNELSGSIPSGFMKEGTRDENEEEEENINPNFNSFPFLF